MTLLFCLKNFQKRRNEVKIWMKKKLNNSKKTRPKEKVFKMRMKKKSR